MNKWPLQNTKDLIAFYGAPDKNNDGRPDIAWEAANIVKIKPPYPMFWSWNGRPVQTISIHKKCAESLLRCLVRIAKIPESNRKLYGLDQCGGGYNFRTMRGLNNLSMHAYGCAIDIAPLQNPLTKPWNKNSDMLPIEVVQIFNSEGWRWGGDFKSRPDCMHFQATRL
jgi:hypothetical protein